MPDDPFNPNTIIEFPNAGKDKFDELFFSRKFLRKIKLRTHEKGWFVYDTKAWMLRKSAYYESLAMNILPEKLRCAKNAEAVMKHSMMIQQLADDEQFRGAICFAEPGEVLINCRNGILRVTADTVKLEKHDEELLFTGFIAADWPGKTYERKDAPLFARVLDELLPDPIDQALQQWFAGYVLYPGCEHEIFLISHGSGGSGKSTLSDAMMAVIGGKPLRTVLSMAQICAEGQGAYSLPSLQHAAVNMGTDLDTVDIGDSANFKRIVSGEPIEVRPIYGDPYTMTGYTTKLWFNSNSLPRFKHGTNAELRRARFLEYVHPPKVKDVTLKARLRAEVNGIFAYMVEGLQAILGGKVCPGGSEASVQVKDKFAISNDPVSAFATECLEFGAERRVKKDALFNEFTSFLNSWSFADKAKAHLFRLFFERFPEVSALRTKPKDGPREHWLRGVCLKSDLLEEATDGDIVAAAEAEAQADAE